MVFQEPLIAGPDFRPTPLSFLLVGLQLAVQLLKPLHQVVELFAEAGKRFLGLRFMAAC